MSPSTLHDGLEALRADRAHEPAASSAVSRLASEFGTPLYVYDRETIVSQFRSLRAAFASRFPKLRIHYALKANGNGALLAVLRAEGAAPEVVSLGEIVMALRAGWAGDEILFTSSSKGPEEIAKAVEIGAVLNVDSRDELEQAATSAAAGKRVRISFRINPGVDPHTLHHINTGIPEAKFGLHLDGGLARAAYARARELPSVAITGIHCHIGSQIMETDGYVATARKMLAFVRELKRDFGLSLEFVDLGGGLAVPYHDGEEGLAPAVLAAALAPVWSEAMAALGGDPPALWLEPGRFFVAPSGFLVTRVNSVKTTTVKTFVNVNAGSNTLLRPAMYAAHHRARVVGASGAPEILDVAGDVCETGDILAAERRLPRPRAGDFVVFLDAGAYGFAMASTYNARPLPAEVLVDGDTATLIRRRGTFEDLFRDETK